MRGRTVRLAPGCDGAATRRPPAGTHKSAGGGDPVDLMLDRQPDDHRRRVRGRDSSNARDPMDPRPPVAASSTQRAATLPAAPELTGVRAVIDALPEAIFVTESDGDLRMTNPAADRLFAGRPIVDRSDLLARFEEVGSRPDRDRTAPATSDSSRRLRGPLPPGDHRGRRSCGRARWESSGHRNSWRRRNRRRRDAPRLDGWRNRPYRQLSR